MPRKQFNSLGEAWDQGQLGITKNIRYPQSGARGLIHVIDNLMARVTDLEMQLEQMATVANEPVENKGESKDEKPAVIHATSSARSIPVFFGTSQNGSRVYGLSIISPDAPILSQSTFCPFHGSQKPAAAIRSRST